uniref:IQ motif containing C n=1 Tax=Suricata suricatta TaxID=37032 RepID=A0A673TZS7_SURSU
MERERLVRAVSVLQACVRGFLVRRHIQRLREEYEAVVGEIEGDLGTLQWTKGWIPRPQFLPKKAKSHRTCKPQERAPNPEQQQRDCFSRKELEREAVLGEMMLKQSGESSADSGSLPFRGDNSPRPEDEHSRQARNPSQEETRDMSGMENPEGVGPGLPHGQTLQELQHHHSHLAMELLWIQQAINSRKEYLILKQTLTSPEASQMRDEPSLCPDHRAQTCDRAGSQTSLPPKDKSYRDRTTEGPDHVDNACWRLKSQPHKCLESLATTAKTTAGVKCRDLWSRRAGSQLSTPSDNQASEARLTGEPRRGGPPFGGPSLRLTRVLEDQIPQGLKPRGCCSAKARMQVATHCDDQDVEDKSPRKPERKEPKCQRARPRELDLSEDRSGIWDETWAEPGGQDLWKTKPPKGQIPSEKSSWERISSEPNHEQWKNQRPVPWLRPPKKLSLAESAHTGEDHWMDKPWKTGPSG